MTHAALDGMVLTSPLHHPGACHPPHLRIPCTPSEASHGRVQVWKGMEMEPVASEAHVAPGLTLRKSGDTVACRAQGDASGGGRATRRVIVGTGVATALVSVPMIAQAASGRTGEV